MDVEALEDSIIQFGGEKTNEIYVASSFEIVDGDLATSPTAKEVARALVIESRWIRSIQRPGPAPGARLIGSIATPQTAPSLMWMQIIRPGSGLFSHMLMPASCLRQNTRSRAHMSKIRIHYTSLREGAG